jgi:hypothetical protein
MAASRAASRRFSAGRAATRRRGKAQPDRRAVERRLRRASVGNGSGIEIF